MRRPTYYRATNLKRYLRKWQLIVMAGSKKKKKRFFITYVILLRRISKSKKKSSSKSLYVLTLRSIDILDDRCVTKFSWINYLTYILDRIWPKISHFWSFLISFIKHLNYFNTTSHSDRQKSYWDFHDFKGPNFIMTLFYDQFMTNLIHWHKMINVFFSYRLISEITT